MPNLTRIVAAVIDTQKATFYKEDGTTIEMYQGDKRLRPILEQITPLLSKPGGYADIDFSVDNNSWKEFQEKTNGAVRLFRIAKNKLASLFGSKKEEETTIGNLGTIPGKANSGTKEETVVAKNVAAVDEILKHAVPVTAQNFHEENVAAQRPTAEEGCTPSDRLKDGEDPYHKGHEDTIVAVTPKGKIIPGVEQIKSQFTSAAESENTKGLTIFLERLGAVLEQRGHSGEDLLRFMERGDMPIADDGTIVIFKKLRRTHEEGKYVDCHTGRVIQGVGSYVHMDPKMVDHNRRTECSNGLHVARRGYIRGFSGNVIVLAKVRPEDVIAVPEYDANKMRVCGYHILAELTQDQYIAINKNRPLHDAPGGAELMGRVLAGDHIGITEMVKIGGDKGTKLTITKINPEGEIKAPAPSTEHESGEGEEKVDPPVIKKAVSKKATKAKRKVAAKKTARVRAAKALEAQSQENVSDKHIDVLSVQKLKEGKAKDLSIDKPKALTQQEVVQTMLDEALEGKPGAAQALLDYKKKAKKGWAVWGLPSDTTDTLKALL